MADPVDTQAAFEALDHRVLRGWAEAGDDPVGRGYAMGLSVAAAAVGRPDEVWASPERRGNVKAEVERLVAERSVIEKIRELHKPFGIYTECDHDHTEADLENDLAFEIMEVGIVCEDGLMYQVCLSCCTGDGFQTEDCATDHKHGKDEPICATSALLEAP